MQKVCSIQDSGISENLLRNFQNDGDIHKYRLIPGWMCKEKLSSRVASNIKVHFISH